MLKLQLQPFPEINTNRLVLRRMISSDAFALHKIRNKEEVMKYICRPRSKTVEEAEQLIEKINENIEKNEAITWAIALQDNPNELIGTMGYYRIQFENYRGEVGYLLDNKYWRKGFMSEALHATLIWGFEKFKFHSIEACIQPDNVASRELLISRGFRKEAYYKENFYFNGCFSDTEVLGLLKHELK